MAIIGIVAVDRIGAIGKDGKLPWHYSSDLKNFKATTTGHAVVMGHKTWLSLQKPLPNRLNIVLSRSAGLEPQANVIVCRSPEEVLALAHDLETDLYVIGGAQIYRAFLEHIENWLVTKVPLTVENADAFVPENYLEGFIATATKELEPGLILTEYVRE